MNFFNNIKETLENVSISLKNQNPEKQKTPEHNIHEFAGAELLLRFQNSWRLIHDDHTYCAKLASDCDSSLKKFQHKVQHNTHLIRNLHNQCKALLTVLGQVDSISNKLKDIALQITKIEEDLTSLECLNIKVFYAEQRRAKEQVFEGRVLLKDALIDNFKKEKIEKSKKEVEEMERVMRMKVQERYATFEEEHKRQMQMYMLTGAVPYHERIKKDKEEKTLSEIQLDFPQEELEGFLKDDLPGTDEDDEEDNNNNNNEEESNMNNNDASNNDSSENNNSNNNNSNNNNSNNNNSNNIHTKNSYQSTFNIGDNESNKTKNNKSPYSIDHDSSSGNNTNRSDNNQNLNSNNVIYAENNFNNDINKPNTINNETFVDGEDFVVL